MKWRQNMLSKRYLPNLGFIILLTTILGSILFVRWSFEPLRDGKIAYKAGKDEHLGYQLASEGNYEEASKHFLTAAKLEYDNISISRLYRCAGSTSANKEDKKKYFNLALKYNPNNQNAKRALKMLMNTIKKVEN